MPRGRLQPVVGGGAAGAALARAAGRRRLLHRLLRAPARRSPSASRARLMRVQLELGGKDPVYVVRRRGRRGGRGRGRRRRVLQHRPELLRGRARLRARARSTTRSSRRSWRRCGASSVGDPSDERTYIGPRGARRAQLGVLERAGRRRAREGRARALRRRAASTRPGSFFEPTVLADVDHTMARDARGELRPA